MSAHVVPVENINAYAYYKPVPAIYAKPNPFSYFGGAGTGGIEGVDFALSRSGYSPYSVVIKDDALAPQEQRYAPYSDLMSEVKTGFGRTMSNLPAVFSVSRQTLYNWLNGDIPKEQHQEKLVQLAAAARVFVEEGFKPNALALDRTILQGKSFVELLHDGADGKETAERLVRIVKRGTAAREKLDFLLGNRGSSRPDISEMGRPSLNEKA
ncbi:MAG TPA: hypothetical protein PLI96_11230 [Halothiobacillus sp.]|nr:hypothetical protein [Halothiobacillus sp.]